MNYVELYGKHLGPGRRSGKDIAFPCFRCDQGERNTRHLYVDPSTGAYCCHKCRHNPDGMGSGGARQFARIMGETLHEAPVAYDCRPAIPETPFDQKAATRVYEFLWRHMRLEADDRREVMGGRGIRHPEAFGIRSCRGADVLLREGFDDRQLTPSGLFCRRGAHLVPHTTIAEGRVLIPYFDGEGSIEFLRSRRGREDGTPKYMSPLNSKSGSHIWGRILPYMTTLVITEGEFKAMAAVEAKIWAVALPGMGTAHGALIERLEDTNVKEAIICFDTQIEGADNVRHTISALAGRIIRETDIGVRVASLPLDPRVSNGCKMDIDSFLYWHTPGELRKVLRQSVPAGI